MNLKCMILEDEPYALQQIENYVNKTSFLSLVSSLANPLEALEVYHKNIPDLLFIDINMPEINGLDFVKTLKVPPLIIFTTAYSEYAIEGFKVDAVDYLLKPIGYPDFLRAATKAKQLFELKLQNNSKTIEKEIITDDTQNLFVRSEHRLIRIRFNDIKYIEAKREYACINLSDGTAVMTLLRLKVIEEKLPKDIFLRVHKSFIVNLNRINIIERGNIVFDKKVYIPVGEQYKDAFDKWVGKHFL